MPKHSIIKRSGLKLSALFFSREFRFYTSAFCIVWSYCLIKPLRYALLASSLGTYSLPYLKIITYCTLALYSFFPTTHKVSSRFFLLIAGICYAFPLMHVYNSYYFDALLFIAFEIIPTTTLALLWSFIHATYNHEEAPTFYPIICLLGEIASVAAYASGALISYFSCSSYCISFLLGSAYVATWLCMTPYAAAKKQTYVATKISEPISLVLFFITLQIAGSCVKIISELYFLNRIEQFFSNSPQTYSFFLYGFHFILHCFSAAILYCTSYYKKNYFIFFTPIIAIIASLITWNYNSFIVAVVVFKIISSTFSALYYPSLMILYKQCSSSLHHLLQNQTPLYSKLASCIITIFSLQKIELSIILASIIWLLSLSCIQLKIKMKEKLYA